MAEMETCVVCKARYKRVDGHICPKDTTISRRPGPDPKKGRSKPGRGNPGPRKPKEKK